MFYFEEMQKCYIKIRAVDSAALSYEAVFQISIRDQYDTTKIILDNAYLNWDVAPGEEVGNFSINADVVDVLNEEWQFSLVEGDGDTHNHYFEIFEKSLKVKDQ